MSALPFVYGGMALLQMYQANAQAELTLQQNRINTIISGINAESAEMDAYKAEQQGYSKVARYQNVIDSTVGSQLVQQAATSDIDVSQGTAAQVRDETRFIGYLNTLDIMQQARARAKQFEMQAANIRLGADMGTYQAQMNAYGQVMQGRLQALSTGISGYAAMGFPGLGGGTEGVATPGSGGGSLGGSSYMNLASPIE